MIFFCDFDYYHRGLARYQFEFREKWHPEIAAGDLRTLVVFNTKAKDYQHAAEIRPFLDMIRGTIDMPPWMRKCKKFVPIKSGRRGL